ncbi:class I SAM-dependent methyltransferase [Luteipulveratus mongoliensis]|uniref:SAM-dependent methyltransferase n=1 Tax=Luteipulveratus mongoliensis TaxID=571913 RepID=A0A0K1JJA3_9MICO|nr:class I SAM-dependent methyltransferase [Luteipulveratus mongoliensis]AKU16787.1 SAM-dependent methyltransferase [Luteipulveratus mongoliensis]
MTDDLSTPDHFGVVRRPAEQAETAAANRTWWDGEAVAYYLEHGEFLGDDELVWGPEGVHEAELNVLGDVFGLRVLEIGAGAAQGGRYLLSRGARVVSSDLSAGMLHQAAALNAQSAHGVPLVQCDAVYLPFGDATLDLVVTAYGAVPFVADSGRLMRECARVLRPGGRLVFSTTHPIRWAFPDAPGPEGLTVRQSYFDRTAYVEQDEHGRATYAEHHRTLGDRVRELTAAGLVLDDLLEPEWPANNRQVWGGWSPLRGELIPGTAIYVARKP